MQEFESIKDALKSLCLPNYGPHAVIDDQLINIELKINQNFNDELNEKTFSHNFGNDKCVMITFQSVADYANKIFWRVNGKNSFNLLEIADDQDGTITKVCENFLLEKLKVGENGILISSAGKKSYSIHDIGNVNGRSLLIDAITQLNIETVSKLLKYNFDLDLEFKFGEEEKNAVGIAWEGYVHSKDIISKNIYSNIVLMLLKADSKFPYDFEYDIASDEIKNFIADCEQLRDFVDSDDMMSLTDKIKSLLSISYFYDDYNESLMIYALKLKKRKIYDLLASLDLNIGYHEIRDLKDIYSSFEERQRKVLHNRNQSLAKSFPKTHILILKSRSKIGNNDRKSREHWRCISEAYELIDQNEGGSKVLQIAATCKGLKIFFDFKHDSTYYFDPYSTASSRGITYTTGLINIGARNLLQEDKKYEVIGVIAHEFCHLAVLMCYMNNFDPYQMGESKDKARFVDRVAAECKENQKCEKFVENVFKLYPEDQQHSELIVLVLQMMMTYYIKDPKAECENSKAIADRKEEFPELFSYFKEVVEPELEKAMKVKLLDDNQPLWFEDLTQPMKAKILHTKVKFQGIVTTLFEVIGNDEDILELLPSEDLKVILVDQNWFNFGDICKMSAKYGYIERNFMKFRNGIEDALKFEGIKSLVDTSKIFILTGKAGSGKTTTFENLSRKLKNSFKNFWISFIRLRNFREIFDEFSKSNVDPSLEEVITLLCKVIFRQARKENFNFDEDFEIRIFKKLFNANLVILLFDGIDEICPRFNIFIANILKLLQEKSKIQLWISTRPQHVEQFEDKFSIESYMLEPYSRYNQRMMISEIFKKANEVIGNNVELVFTNVSKIFKKYTDFNNPLIIVIITELYISGKINFETDSIDLYEIYEKLIDTHVEKVESKIDSKDRSIFLDFKFLFQVLALKFIFEDKDIRNLSIIRRWKRKKRDWTADTIQRFGFVIVDLTFLETDDRNSIDFIHKTFAEYFVVQFIVEAIFNEDEDIRKEEIDTVFMLVEYLESEENNSFLLSFFNNKANIKDKCLQSNIKELISKQIEKNINSNQLDSKILVFWCQFLQNDPATLKKLWKGTGTESLFRNLYFYRKSAMFLAISSLIHFLCNCLGDNWFEVLMDKSVDVADKHFPWGDVERRSYDIHFFKLLHFMEENFSRKEKKLFWRDFFCYFQALDERDIPEDILSILFDEIYKLYPNEEGILLHIIKRFLCKDFTSVHISSFMRCLELTLKNDHRKIQKVLFSKTVSKAFMENLSDEDNNDFMLISSLYIRYKTSWDDVQNVFIKYGNFFKIFKNMQNSLPTFIEQLRIIFESNKDKLILFINSCEILFQADAFMDLESFLAEIFNGDGNFLIQGMRAVLYRDDKFDGYIRKLGAERIHNFPQIITIYRKYQSSQDEFTSFFKSWPILSEMFVLMTGDDYDKFKEFIDEIFASNKIEIIDLIQYSNWNQTIYSIEKNFVLLEKFATDYFNGNEEDGKEFIKKVIKYSRKDTKYHKNNYFEHFLLSFFSESRKSFERIRKILTKYLTKDELKEQFLTQSIYTKAFGYGDIVLPVEFSEFIHEIFGENLTELMDSKFCPDDNINLVLDEEYLRNFENFTLNLFGKDGNHVKIFIKKMFFNPENFKDIFINVCKFYSILGFQNFFKILENFKDSWEELQDILITSKIFLNVFPDIEKDFYQIFENFITKMYESNKPRLLESINFNEGYLMIEDVEKFKLFEEFLTKFYENDENRKFECIRKILFAEYPAEHFPLLTFARSKHAEHFKLLKYFYRTYKTSLDELQAYFASIPISSLIFNHMTEESFLRFKDLIVEIYGTDKTLLRKSYQSIATVETKDADELFSSDIDYIEDVEKYYFDREVMESFREDFDKFVFEDV